MVRQVHQWDCQKIWPHVGHVLNYEYNLLRLYFLNIILTIFIYKISNNTYVPTMPCYWPNIVEKQKEGRKARTAHTNRDNLSSTNDNDTPRTFNDNDIPKWKSTREKLEKVRSHFTRTATLGKTYYILTNGASGR